MSHHKEEPECPNLEVSGLKGETSTNKMKIQTLACVDSEIKYVDLYCEYIVEIILPWKAF